MGDSNRLIRGKVTRMNNDVPTLNSVKQCPHCRTQSPLLYLVWHSETEGSKFTHRRLWGTFCCNSCGGLVSAYTQHTGSHSNLFNYPDQTYPQSPKAHEDLPPIAGTFLQQAIDTLHAPDAAAVMAGSAVDAMLKSKGLLEGSLYNRIDKAHEQGILTKGMADWAHEVRLGSNRPRHADEGNPHVTPEEAQQSVDFAEALGNFLFVLTAKIERGIAAAAKTK